MRDGTLKVTAKDYPNMLFKDCSMDPEDMENGLLMNEAHVRVSIHVFIGANTDSASLSSATSTYSGARRVRRQKIMLDPGGNQTLTL